MGSKEGLLSKKRAPSVWDGKSVLEGRDEPGEG